MKKVLSFLLAALVSSTAFSQTLKDLKVGSRLTYHVKAFGKEYDYIVTLTQFASDKSISFNWQMTAPVNTNGSIYINGLAQIASYAWYNRFHMGPDTLYNETSVFISALMREDMGRVNKGETLPKPIQINGYNEAGDDFTITKKDELISYKVNGKTITETNGVALLDKADKSKNVVISLQSIWAVITHMNIGFEIKLMSVEF